MKIMTSMREKFADNMIDLFRKKIEPGQKLLSYYRCALMEVETKFKVLSEEFSLEHERNPIDTIKTRVKSPDSIAKKMRKLNLPRSFEAMEENLSDIAGIRVICPFIDDIYFLANCLINQDDITLLEQKDYISNPKENGYRSLHLIISIPIFLHNLKRQMKVEIQLRTIAMDFWANLEHRLRYKKDLSENMTKKISDDLLECAKTSSLLDSKMQGIKNQIDEVHKNHQKMS